MKLQTAQEMCEYFKNKELNHLLIDLKNYNGKITYRQKYMLDVVKRNANKLIELGYKLEYSSEESTERIERYVDKVIEGRFMGIVYKKPKTIKTLEYDYQPVEIEVVTISVCCNNEE